MRLLTSLLTGRESLISQSTALGAVSDNIANSNTTGFKSSRAEFSTIFAEGLGLMLQEGVSSGNGVAVREMSTQFQQGPVEFTERGLDFAINGSGFFILNNGTEDFYTRAGNFTLDELGNLVSNSGEAVMGFSEESPDTLVPISFANIAPEPEPTTLATIRGNLDNEAVFGQPVANPDSFAQLTNASQFNSNIRVYDTLGVEHDIALQFFHTGVNTWTVEAYGNGDEVGGEVGPVQLGNLELTFNGLGQQDEGALNTLELNPAWGNGAAESAFTLDFSAFTGYGAESGVTSLTVDGLQVGEVAGFTVEPNGEVVGLLDNGQRVTVGTMALADFRNRNGLERIGTNRFQAGETTGERNVAAAGTGALGTLKGSTLEMSNVDLSQAFIDVIRFQRAYQAGSSVIQTANDLLNTTIQIA